jgi:prepilin peptidase CpaA
MAEILVLGAFPALLALAAIWDLASYTIPNWLPLALTAAFLAFAAATAMPFAAIGLHAAAGLCALIVGIGFFAFGWIGGGDAKLFAATALWLGFHDLMTYALVAALFGGALTLGLLFVRRFPLPARLAAQGWILRLHGERSGIPYGVALAVGAIVLLPGCDLVRGVVGS